MEQFQADIKTTHASRYLQQLCKHWSHRFEVEFDSDRGLVRMTGADCAFKADTAQLHLTLTGDAAPRLREVVAEHLQRFAFREQLEITWRECGAA